MGFRIDKTWTNLGQINPVKRKETTDAIDNAIAALSDSAKQGNRQNQNKDQSEGEAKDEPTRYELEQAIAQMKESDSFKCAGLIIELIVTAQGLKVKMMQATGNVIKLMTGSEFMKLKIKASDDNASRGKILDAKY